MWSFYRTNKEAVDLLVVVLGLGVPALAFVRWADTANHSERAAHSASP